MTQVVKPAPCGGAYARHGLGISDPVCEKEAGFAGDQRRGITDLVEGIAGMGAISVFDVAIPEAPHALKTQERGAGGASNNLLSSARKPTTMVHGLRRSLAKHLRHANPAQKVQAHPGISMPSILRQRCKEPMDRRPS